MDYDYILNLVKNEEIDIHDIPSELLDEKIVWQIIKDDYFDIRFFSVSGEEKPITEVILKSEKLFAIWQVYNDGEEIKNIKKELIDEKLCKLAVSCGNNSEKAIKYIPQKYINEDICHYAILSGASLKYIPIEFQNRKLYESAVYHNYDNIKLVPKEHKDFNLYKRAVQGSCKALRFVPKRFLTEELYISAIEKSYEALKIIPEDKITEKMCETAVDNAGIGLSLVPEKYKTIELCSRALKKDGRVIYYVPEKYYKIIDFSKLINSCATAIEWINPKYLNYKDYKIAVSKNSYFLKYVPKEFLDKDMYLSAVKGFGMITKNSVLFFEKLPMELKNYDFFKECIKNNGDVIACKPSFLNCIDYEYDLYKTALQSKGTAIKYVPEKYFNKEMIILSLKTNVTNSYGSPLWIIICNCKKFKKENLLTQEIFNLAVHKSPKALEYVPEEFKTLEMCQKAYSRTKKIIRFIPKKFHDKLEFLQKQDNKANKLKKIEHNKFLEKTIFEILTNNPNTTIKQIINQLGENENKITTIVRKLRKDCKVSSFIQEAPVQESIKSALQQKPLTKIELVKITGRTYKSIETALTKMKKNNLVLNQNGLWFLV